MCFCRMWFFRVDMWKGPLGVLGPLERGRGVIFGGWYDASAEGSVFGGG